MSTNSPTVSFTETTSARFDGAGLFRFFAVHAIAGVETGTETSYSRSIRLPHSTATVEFALDSKKADAPGIRCSATLSPSGHAGVTDARGTDARGTDARYTAARDTAAHDTAAREADTAALGRITRRLFDLDTDSVEVDGFLARDPALARSVRLTPGIRLPGAADIEEALFRTLIGQQVSVAAATTVLGRVCRELAAVPGAFPTAHEFATRGADVLRGPAGRVASIIAVAEHIADGSVVLDERMPVAEFTATLVAQRGIGPWTAGYVAMRALGARDELLVGDLIMRQSAEALGLPSSPKGLAGYGARWSPWRSYAGLHLWRSIGR